MIPKTRHILKITVIFVLMNLLIGLVLNILAIKGVAAQSESINATSAVIHTIDFSTHGGGPFQPDFYKKDGVVFIEGLFVGFVQGDDALITDIAGTFTPPISSLSARVAPGFQGTFEYTLTAFDASMNVVASTSLTVPPPDVGYATIDLGVLPRTARYFTLTASGASGVSSITYSSPRTTP